MHNRRFALIVCLLVITGCIFSVQAFEQGGDPAAPAGLPFVGTVGGAADIFWHLLLDGPALLADAVAGFTLSVTSEPSGAAIILDGNDTGVTTPAEIGNVSVGVRNVTVVLDGYLPGVNETVEGTAGETTAVRFDLAAEAGGDEDLLIEPSFSADPISGTAPLAVQFTDTSAGAPTEWLWEFGDGETSAEQNPVHTYVDAGTYTVSLTVWCENGTATAVREDCIEAAASEEPAFEAFAAPPIGSPSPSTPTAAFSGAPTSGVAPLTVDFTDASTGSPTGWAWFFGDEGYDEAWTEQNGSAGWAGRSGLSSVTLHDGSIVLMGGYTGSGYKNDVWRSADGGTTWTCVNASAGWAARQYHTSAALPDGSIILMGGTGSGINRNDVWQSTDDGATWTCVNASAGWAVRNGHASVVLPDGSIVLMGGRGNSGFLSDTWRSTDGGATWTCVNASAGWAARQWFTSVVLPDESIVIMGGNTGSSTYTNDTWRSTDGGATWTCVNASSGWAGRYGLNSAVLPDGSIVIMGGSSASSSYNDMWRSTDNGATWTQLSDAGWTKRRYAAGAALPDGSVVLMGGYVSSSDYRNDTWQFQPAGSSEQNPTHTYTAPGTYPVTLQASNADGYNASTIVDYITVSAPAPVANFTANVTAGLTPLAVQFNDTSTGSPTAWNWTFGDGSFSEEQNPVHTYSNAGTYTVNLTAGNVAGTDTLSRIGFITVTPPPPTAAFSGTPTSGATPLNVTFTDASTGNPTGWAWFFGDESYSEAWTQVNASAGWTGRWGHTSVTLPDGSIVLMGGFDSGGMRNDVWRSTDNGVTWTEQNASAGWAARYLHASVAMPDGSIVLMGGFGQKDVWRSVDNGATWTCMNANAEWSTRCGQTSVAMPDGSIVLMGGMCGSPMSPIYKNDVWQSTDNGATWTQVNASAGWTGRESFTSAVLPDGSIVLAGGSSGSSYNDVWRSTDGGATWTCMTASAGWTARSKHTSVAMPDGSVILMGGQDASYNFKNDVWRSTDCGATWTEINASPGWSSRQFPTAVTMPDGSVVLIGGSGNNDVWRFQPAGSNEQSPSHTYTTPGTYPVTLQASNAGGYNATTMVDYITVTSPPLVAAFSGTPTSGPAPMTVNFTDASTGTPTGWAWFFGDESYSEAWTEQTESAGWDARVGHTSVAMPDGSIVLMGGDGYGGKNDVWRSTDDGVTWTCVNESAGWPARSQHTSVALPDGSIVLMGGGIKNDVWRSTDGGAIWTCVNESAGWSGRYGHTSVALPDGSIVLAGGYDGNYKNDVWRSTDGGATWACVNASAGWTERRYSSSVALPDGSIVLMGGYDDGGPKNDVWRSTDNGATWTEVTADAGWTPRYDHTSVALPDGSIVLAGGNDYLNDVWRSTDGGATWTRLPDAGWDGRYDHTSVALPDGSIVLLGGKFSHFSYLNDVWRLQPAGSTEQSPSHTYTTAGNYSVTLQAYNAAGYNTTMAVDYITVVAAPVANFTANATSGTAPLAVQFSDTSSGSPTAWNWTFGDGSFSEEQNPVHTYVSAGTYTVNLTAGNAGGTDTLSRTGFITVTSPPPVAAFSGTPTSGMAPLNVTFTDASTGDPTGWVWFFGDESYSEVWTEQTASAGCGQRVGHTGVTLPDGSIILMGGADMTATKRNDVWRSTDNGTTWTQVNASAGWAARQYHTSVALPDGSIVIMGGTGTSGGLNDVWCSTDGGAIWTCVNASAGWTARSSHSSVALQDGSIVLMGGSDGTDSLNDTWRSTDGGATWTEQTASAGWAARSAHSSVALPDGSVVLMGGSDGSTVLNDTWRSTDAGATWVQATASAGWTARTGHSSLTMPDGSIVLAGGMDTTFRNDVWRSTDGGTTWTQLSDAGWPARGWHADVATLDGSILVMGGASGFGPRSDVWRLQPAGSTEQNPTHTYTEAGTYPVTLQAYNAGGYDASTAVDYITVVGAPVANFTANATAGTAPLAVKFTDASSGSPTVWNWTFGDGSSSEEQNPVHTYAVAGTYTVNLTAGNAGGTGTLSRAGYVTVTVPPPAAAFSGTPTSGAAPLAVQFTDDSSGSPAGWAWFFGDESYGEAWTEQNASAGWPVRSAHSSVALPDGSVVVMGGLGEAATCLNDVWRSTDGGATWTCVNASPGWAARAYHTSVALPDGSIVLMGGKDGSNTFLNDTWRSTDNGATWTLVNASAGWTARICYTSVALPDGSIVLAGGMDDTFKNDVWYSTDGGATWTCINASAGWSARMYPGSAVLSDGSIVLTGGLDGGYKNDVWRSTDTGATWTCMNASAGWSVRIGHSSVAMPDGSVLLVGGFDGDCKNDTWRSTDGGATWTEVNTSAGWPGRFNLAGVAQPDGSIVLTGGSGKPDGSDPKGDVWRLDPAGSSEQSPSHTYTIPGTYPVTLQAYNAGGYNATTAVDYITVVAPAPTTNFTYAPSEGNAPLTVQFNDTSIGDVTAWNWTFGDGSFSNEQNPIHTYASAETYTVSLNASNTYGFNVSTVADAVRVLEGPTANFTYTPNAGNAPLTVQFNNTSAGNVTAWSWGFGDGNTSAEQDPVHTYTSAGTYTVSLNVSNAYGFSVSTAPDAISVLPAPVAGFTFAPDEGNAPLAVQFNDTSAGDVAAWFWDFGDGQTSAEQNPEHLYASAGTYTVSLNASNPYGFNVSTIVDAVVILEPPVAGFTFGPDEGNAPLTVQFNDTSAGNVTAWSWDFGDGQTSAEENPEHTYMTTGTYTVMLNASNAYAFSVSTVTDAVSVLEPPIAGFTIAPSEGNAPLLVTFDDASSGNITTWHWNFGDGNVSSEQNPIYTYASAGTFTVTLNASNAYGFNVSTVADAVQVLPAPVAGFTYAPDAGNAPLAVQFNDASAGNVTTWHWDFGDGATSTDRNPAHTYAAAGNYTVALNASNVYGWNVSTVSNAVRVLVPPAAGFAFGPTEGNAPLAVTFTDASAGNVTDRLWDFGDGNTSTETNPIHTYAVAGAYTVSLNASNAYGFNVSTETEAVHVLAAPVAGFTVSPARGENPLTVAFASTSTGNVTALAWDFGDGSTSTEANPSHTYTLVGTYSVTLNVSNAYGSNTLTRQNAVTVVNPGGDDGGDVSVTPTVTATPTPTPTPTPTQGAAELTADADGRVLETIVIVASDTVGMLTIPGGVQALDAEGGHLREIIIEPTEPVNITPEQNATVNGSSVFLLGRYAYRVEPEGATFNPPITLTFNIPRDEWATLDTANLSILWQHPTSGAWENVPIASIDGNATHVWVTAAISHFSIYGLFAPETVPATPQATPSTVALAEAVPVAPAGQIPFLAIAVVVVLIVAGAALYVWKQKTR